MRLCHECYPVPPADSVYWSALGICVHGRLARIPPVKAVEIKSSAVAPVTPKAPVAPKSAPVKRGPGRPRKA